MSKDGSKNPDAIDYDSIFNLDITNSLLDDKSLTAAKKPLLVFLCVTGLMELAQVTIGKNVSMVGFTFEVAAPRVVSFGLWAILAYCFIVYWLACAERQQSLIYRTRTRHYFYSNVAMQAFSARLAEASGGKARWQPTSHEVTTVGNSAWAFRFDLPDQWKVAARNVDGFDVEHGTFLYKPTERDNEEFANRKPYVRSIFNYIFAAYLIPLIAGNLLISFTAAKCALQWWNQ